MLYGHPQAVAKSDLAEPSSFGTSCSLNKIGGCPQSDSVYKSQISSWIEGGPSMKCASISTAFSKRANEAAKPNRKRPRPGENPDPVPKIGRCSKTISRSCEKLCQMGQR